MKPQPSSTAKTSSHDARIDAALAHYARAVPSPDMESRVSDRVSAALRQTHRPGPSLSVLIVQRFSVGALGFAAACAIVVGTVQHSNRSLPPLPGRHQPNGIGPANGGHTPTQATPATPSIDPQAPRTPPHSRATISRNQGRHASGAAVPRSPYPPGEQPAATQQ